MKRIFALHASVLLAGAAFAAVNINTATKEELDKIPDIGPTRAQAIIDYRAEHGDFTAAEDLLNVKGIGEAKLEGFRAEITFTEENGDENSGG